MDSPLTQARKDRKWSQARLIAQLRLAARADGTTLPEDSTLRVTLSRWENGQHRPQEVYIKLLCDALEVTPADLGFTGLRSEPSRSAYGRTPWRTWPPRCSYILGPTTPWGLGS